MIDVTLPAFDWRPRPYQEPLWDALKGGARRAMVIAHRRWGKDDIALHHTACAAHERIGSYIHCLPEYAQARKAIWEAVNSHTGRRRIDEAFPEEIRANTRDDTMFIRFKCGSTWQVVGSDNYNSLVGAGYAGIVFSEWALANPTAWAYFQPILVENNGWAVFITTPRGNNHAKSMYDAAERSKIWYSEFAPVSSTNAMSQSALEEAREDLIALYNSEELGDAQFRQEYHCAWDAPLVGSYYGREFTAADAAGRIRDNVLYDPDYPVHTAWDLGYSDDTTIWWYQVIAGEVRILECYSENGRDVEHYASVIKERPYKYGKHWLPHDAKAKTLASGGKSVQEQLASHLGWGSISIVPNLAVQDGIQAVRAVFPKLYFCKEKCKDGIDALRQYRREWDDDKKCFDNKPLHNWTSHYSDAFRMLAVAWKNEYKPTEEKKIQRTDAWGRPKQSKSDWMTA